MRGKGAEQDGYSAVRSLALRRVGLPPDTTTEALEPNVCVLSRLGKRVILNEMRSLLRVARQLGAKAERLVLETLPLEEQIQRLQRCSVFVGVHGSGLWNAFLLPLGASTVILQPWGAGKTAALQGGADSLRESVHAAQGRLIQWHNAHREDALIRLPPKMAHAPLKTQRNFVNKNVWSAGINQDVALRSEEMRTLLTDALRKAHPGLTFPRALDAREPRRATPPTRGNSDAPTVLLDPTQQDEATHRRAASRLSVGTAGLSSTRKERAPGVRAPFGLHIPSMGAMFMLGCMVGVYVRRSARAQSVH